MADGQIIAIVLAAGASVRMGQPKLLLPINGKSLLERAVTTALEGSDGVVVVTGRYHERLLKDLGNLTQQLTIVENKDWASGMSASIATGIRAAKGPEKEAYLILLADQPTIDDKVLQRLFAAYRSSPSKATIVATAYPEGPGVPAIFPVRYRTHLKNEGGAEGAKHLLRSGHFPVQVVNLGGVPFDVDTPEDYRQYTGELPPEP